MPRFSAHFVRLAIFCAFREASKTTGDENDVFMEFGRTTKAELNVDAHDTAAATETRENFIVQ
jgi:hypothetical protein